MEGIEIISLKNKLGTRQLPSAELRLTKVTGIMLGKREEGIKYISDMLNITRLHNSVSALGFFRRVLNIAIDYSHR